MAALLALLALTVQPPAAPAAPAVGAALGPVVSAGAQGRGAPAWPGFAARLRRAVAAGEVSPEQSLLYRFEYAFEPARLPAGWRPAAGASGPTVAAGAAARPAKDLTALIAEFGRRRSGLSARAISRIEGYLAPAAAPAAGASILSPSGRFRLAYELEGPDAVPAEDVAPADGVPDYVQRVARYFDRAWIVLVDSLQMAAPALAPTYEVGFAAMDAYGYTIPTGDGRTRIVVHDTFLGFPANDDPEGSRWGAAKVTAAHELEHACQYEATRWSEGGWGEVDATWAEDVVFDQVNDYVNYLYQDSPLSDPEQPLDEGGTGSYPDCIWERWLSENHGAELISQLWRARGQRPQTAMLDSYATALARTGSSLAEAWAGFAAWNWLTGAGAVAGTGYREAASYPQPAPAAVLSSYPGASEGALDHLAAAFVVCDPLPRAGRLHVRLERGGHDGLSLGAILRPRAGGVVIERLPGAAGGPAEGTLSLPAEDLAGLVLVVANGGADPASDPAVWSVRVEAEPSAPQAVAAPALVLLGAVPNPFNPTTRIDFDLARETEVRLEILDLAGRRVRLLFSGRLPAGRQGLAWDGSDGRGRPCSAGVYFAVLTGAGNRRSARLTLLR